MKKIEINLDKMRIHAYGYGCYGSPYNGDADVEMDMQNFLDRNENGRYEVSSKAEYFEDEDCWTAKIIETDL